MPLIQRFHPNLEENVEEEYVEVEDRGETDTTSSGEENNENQSMGNGTRNYANENMEGELKFI